MEECLKVLKKLHDICVTLVNKNQRYIGPSIIIWLSVNFSSELMIPVLCERVRLFQLIINSYGFFNGNYQFMYN